MLTPNHFCLGRNGTSFPSLSFQEHFDHRKQYIRVQSYANTIWSRWLRDYVPALNKRSKWHSDSDVILKTGDLVWIVDKHSPRGHYPLARIKTINYGKDNIARVTTRSGELTRPAVKLAPFSLLWAHKCFALKLMTSLYREKEKAEIRFSEF